MSYPKVIALVGPTASGKTDVAIAIAKHFNGEVIQADSRNVYRKMDIGTAKPRGVRRAAAEVTLDEIREQGIHAKHKPIAIASMFEEKPLLVDGIPHWGIDLVDPDESFTAAEFKAYAEKHIFNILDRGKLPILTGGTGLYISAVVDNLSFSDVEPDLELRAELDRLSDDQLRERLAQIDPEAAESIDVHNRRRLLRAIEIIERTGNNLASQQVKGSQKFDVLMLGMKVDREVLYDRIDSRVDEMVASGLIDEVRALKREYGCEINSMTGIGYRQICAFLDGYMKLRDAIEVLKRDTRHYAKRQMTWFKRDGRIKWVESAEEGKLFVSEFLGSGPRP